MLSTPDGVTYNIPMSYAQYTPVKKPSARKFLCQFTETLYVKPKTDLSRLCNAKPKRKSIIAGSMLWSSIPKRLSHTKIN